jgi:hypothetical protein
MAFTQPHTPEGVLHAMRAQSLPQPPPFFYHAPNSGGCLYRRQKFSGQTFFLRFFLSRTGSLFSYVMTAVD